MEDILHKIVTHKLTEIERAKLERPSAVLTSRLPDASPARDFLQALKSADDVALIAEVKKASPIAGIIREPFFPVEIAQTYEQHGASCVSVLTDEHFFHGHIEFLTRVKQSVGLPVLRKEFILDPYQVLEARSAGADAVLLIAECLDGDQLPELYAAIHEYGMTPLVEFYDPAQLPRVLDLSPPLIGINNRNLITFERDLNHSIRLRKEIPDDVLVVSESCIRSRADVERLRDAGVGAILVGESLTSQSDIGKQVEELIGRQTQASG